MSTRDDDPPEAAPAGSFYQARELEVLLPGLGESIDQVLLSRWLKQPGDPVRAGEPLLEVETDKMSIEIPAPSAGVLVAQHVAELGSVLVGGRVATLAVDAAAGEPAPAEPTTEPDPPAVQPLAVESPPRTLVVIGGGLAGFAAARRAGALGRRVVLIDEGEALGGYELAEGGHLRAAWLDAARRVAEARQDLAPRGLRCSVELDLPALREHAEDSRVIWPRALAMLLKQVGGALRTGRARWAEPGVVELGDERFEDVDLVLATGPALTSPPGVELDGERIVALGRAAGFTQVPARLLVIGSSAEALEWAGVWLQLGASVTLALRGPITPDPKLDARWLREFRRVGGRIEAAPPASLARVDDEIEARLAGDRRERFDRVLVERVQDPARPPARVDATGRTEDPRVWAAGGVTGTRWPEEAIAEGWLVAGRICDDPGWTPLVRETVPHVIQGPVELAWVGPTVAQLDARRIPHVFGGFPMVAHARGRAQSGPGASGPGFVHLLAHAGSGRVLAAQALGPGAGELVCEAASAIAMGASLAELARIPRPLSSWSFGVGEAARFALGRALGLFV